MTDQELQALKDKESDLLLTVQAARKVHEQAVNEWHEVFSAINRENLRREVEAEIRKDQACS